MINPNLLRSVIISVSYQFLLYELISKLPIYVYTIYVYLFVINYLTNC